MSAFLKPDNIRTVKVGSETLTINEKIIPDGLRATKREAAHIPEGGLKKPNLLLNDGNGALGITTHNTSDIKVNPATTPAEQYVRSTYNGNMLGVVVTFYVWRDVIWQSLRENERGWHASDGTSRRASNRPGVQIGGNLDTISIEAIGNDPQTVKTTQLLIAYLLREHNLNPETDVYTHLYFDRNSGCPAFILPRWESFMAGIKDYYNADKQPPLTSEDALTALRAAAGIIELNKEQTARLDIDKDGKVTSADALMILKIAAGLVPGLQPKVQIFKAGDRVRITAAYAASAFDPIAQNTVMLGAERVITKIHTSKGVNFAFQLGVNPGDTSSANTTGFANVGGIVRV